MLKLIDIFGAVSILLSYVKNMFKSSITSDKKVSNLLNAFLCHYIQELYTFKNGQFFLPTLYNSFSMLCFGLVILA